MSRSRLAIPYPARLVLAFTAGALMLASQVRAEAPSPLAREVAERAAADLEAVIETLEGLVSFETVHREGLENAENPQFQAMVEFLRSRAESYGLDFVDHGAVVVIGLGERARRLGVVAHGDVQPADASKWESGPFQLDAESEPGRLVARGVEDDKGPLAAVLHAMRAVREAGVPLARRIELIVSLTEESDWEPFERFLEDHPPPQLNVVTDAEFPVVVAEKGWCSVYVRFPPGADSPERPRLESLQGGSFLTQIPEEAVAVIADPTPELVASIRAEAAKVPEVGFELEAGEGALTVRAHGASAHSSKPEAGLNAITHLAALLGAYEWPDTQAARVLRFILDLVGTGHYAQSFGDIALSHPFMGRLTLSLTTLALEDADLVAGINIRSPVGRSGEELERLVREAIASWQERAGVEDLEADILTFEPYYQQDAPHLATLLDIFGYYTESPDPRPIAIGGGTHAQLLPNGVSFGPALPGDTYTGHTEHEYLSRENLPLLLRIYAAMLVDLAGAHPDAETGRPATGK